MQNATQIALAAKHMIAYFRKEVLPFEQFIIFCDHRGPAVENIVREILTNLRPSETDIIRDYIIFCLDRFDATDEDYAVMVVNLYLLPEFRAKIMVKTEH